MSCVIDETGHRYGRLVVLRRVAAALLLSQRPARWECRCDCGTLRVVTGGQLRAGNVKSCGCLKREYDAERRRRHEVSEAAYRSFQAKCLAKRKR